MVMFSLKEAIITNAPQISPLEISTFHEKRPIHIFSIYVHIAGGKTRQATNSYSSSSRNISGTPFKILVFEGYAQKNPNSRGRHMFFSLQ
jgi:hypothetical protein